MSGEQQDAANGNTAVEDVIDDQDADFDSGFNGTETPTETPAPATEKTPEPTAAPAPSPEYVQITKEQWEATQQRAAKVDEITATWNKRYDQAFGRLGGLERTLKEMAQKAPEGDSVQISDEDFADLKREYPEMADYTIAGLTKVLGKIRTGASANPDAVSKALAERLDPAIENMRKEVVNSSLEAVFPGWTDDINTQAFKDWHASQTEEVKALINSDKLRDAAKMLKLFYADASKPPPTPAPTQPPVNTRQRQLAAAVPPKGDGGHAPAPTEDDEFEQGYKTRKG